MSKKSLLALALALSTGGAFAQSTIPVSANVSAVCNLNAGSLAFGAYNPLSTAAVDANATVSVECSRGSVPKIELDNGQNFATTRRMRLGAGTDFLAYNIYQPVSNAAGAACAYTTPWGTGSAALTTTAAPSTAARTYNVCGRLPASQDVPIGSYTDNVAVTIAF